MSATARILILTADPKLRDELDSALHALGEAAPRHRFVADRVQLFDAARTSPPSLILIEFGTKPREVLGLVRELTTLVPSAIVAAVFRPEGLADEGSESSVIIDAMRAGVRDFLRRPVSTNELRTLIAQIGATGHVTRAATTGRVVSFISNKGGVGKSTLAVNAAVGLAMRRPGRVLLIDASLQMGVAAALLDLTPQATLTDAARERDRLDVTMIRQLATPHESGLHLLAAPADAVEAMEVDDSLIARLIHLARQAYDFVIVDTFPLFDRVVIATLDLSDRSYIVLENVVPTLMGAVKLLDVLDRIGLAEQRQSVIVNRCQRISGSLSLEDVATRLGRPIDHVLPFDKRVMIAANSGQPVAMQTFRFGKFSRGLRQLIADIEQLPGAATAADSQARNGHTAPAAESPRHSWEEAVEAETTIGEKRS